MTLTDSKIEICLKVVLKSPGFDVWVSLMSFQKCNMADLNSFQQKRYRCQWKFRFYYYLLESWNIMLNFSIVSVGGCWGHPMVNFLNWLMKLKYPNLRIIQIPSNKILQAYLYLSCPNYFWHFNVRYPVVDCRILLP